MKVAVIGTGKQFIKRVSALNFKEDRLVGISYFTKHNYNLKRTILLKSFGRTGLCAIVYSSFIAHLSSIIAL